MAYASPDTAVPPAPTIVPREVAFIDTGVSGWEELAAGIRSGIEVVLLDVEQSGLEQMADWAATHSGYAAIHVLSHGTEGTLSLATNTITLDSLAESDIQADLTALGQALTPDGDILLYGCSIAMGASGQAFLARLTKATGADIAASDDLTGAAAKGGDWQLETATGEIDSESLSPEFTDILSVAGANVTVNIDQSAYNSNPPGTDIYTEGPVAVTTGEEFNWGTSSFNIDAENSQIIIWCSSDSQSPLEFPAEIVFSGGILDSITSITKNNSATTILNANQVTASVTGTDKKVTVSFGNGTAYNGYVVFDFTSTSTSTAPTTTISAIDISADTGTSATDFITNTASQTITGTLSAGLAGGEILYGSVDGGSNWTDVTNKVTGTAISWDGATLSGSSSIRFKVTDASANDGTVASQAYTLDALAPNAPSAPDMTAGTDSGVNTDNITDDTTPTFTGTAEADSTVTLYDTDGTTSLGTATATGGNWSITSSALSAGAHTLTVTATDAAGNVSVASSGLAVTIDATAPSAPSAPDMTAGTDSGTANTDNTTNDTTPTFTGTAEANATVTLISSVNGTVGTASADGSGNWSITASALNAGAHTITATTTDTAGNVSVASSGLAVTIDASAPAITLSALNFTADTGTSGTDFITQTAAQTIGATLSVGLGAGDIVYGSLDNGGTWTDITSKVSGTTLSWDGVTLTASNTLKLKVTDSAGNDGTVASQAYTLDTAAPVITAVSIPNSTMKVGATVTATITVADDGGSVYTLGSGSIGGFTLGSLARTNSTTYTATFTVTADGADVAAASDIPVSLVLTDPAGNSNSAYTTAIAQAGDAINAHSPTDIALGNSSIATIAGTNAVVGALSSTDGSSGDTFTYSLVAGAGDTDNASFNISGGNLRVTDAATLSAGNSYSVRVQTTDAAGNSYQEALTVNAVANNSPTIDLNGGGAGTGNTVTLANAASGLAAATATASDSELDSSNWNGGSLAVQRVTGGVADGSVNDVFSFTSGGSFSATGTIAKGADSGGTLIATVGSTQFATWTYTSATGKLDIAFDTDATSAQVQDVVRHIGYSNATPYGDATIRFGLNDGSSTTNADVTVTSTTIHVDQTALDADGDATDGFNLQEALAIAKDGDTILIHDGTYRGQFDVTKNVTIDALNGAAGHVTLEAPDAGDLQQVLPNMLTNNGRWRMPVVNVDVADPDTGTVTIKNLTIDGRDQGLADGFANNKDLLGIGIVNSNALVDNVTLSNFRSTDSSEWGWGENFPVMVEADASLVSKVYVTIQNSDISTFQKTGIIGWGPKLDITVDNTTITGSGTSGISGQNGIQIGSGGLRTGTTATITDNTITNFGFLSTDYRSSGVLLVYADTSTITGNAFEGVSGGTGGFVGVGINDVLNTSTVLTISGNTLTDADYGVLNEAVIKSVLNIGSNDFSGATIAVHDSYLITDPATEMPFDNDTTINTQSAVAPASGRLAYYLYDGADSFTDTGTVDSIVYGGGGNDTISTGSGDDELAGGLGNDTLTGGDGDDVFLYQAEETDTSGTLVIYDITDFGTDTITDFGSGDAIRVIGRNFTSGTITVGDGTSVAANSVQISVSGGNTTLYIDTDDTANSAELEVHLSGTYTLENFRLDGSFLRYYTPPVIDPPSTTPPAGTPAGTPSGTYDGVTITASTETTSGGATVTTVTVPLVTDTRQDDPHTTNQTHADIPLATNTGGETLLEVSIPTGVGLSSQQITATNGQTLRDVLIAASDPRIANDSVFQEVLQTGIDAYVPTVADEAQVTVRTITFTSASQTPGGAIIVTGAQGTGEDNAAHSDRQEALVIDVRALPPGTVLQLDTVEFAIIIGATRVEGGDGRNFVVGDDAAQFIVLGAEDDQLYGGAGDDTVASKGGDDRLFGDAGADWLVGGVGADVLQGGDGDDLLQGGMSDAGTWSVFRDASGQTHVRFVAQEAALTDLPRYEEISSYQRDDASIARADPRAAFLHADMDRVEDIALLYHAVLGELPDNAAINYWARQALDTNALAAVAYTAFVSNKGDWESTAAQVRSLFMQVWGEASDDWVAIGTDYIAQGGSWAEGFLYLARDAKHKTPLLNAQGWLPVMQDLALNETGWSPNGGNDALYGGAGNDRLVGGDGNDLLDGGAGIDMVIYKGNLADYALGLRQTAEGGVELALRNVESGEIDILRDVELGQIGGQVYGARLDAPLLALDAFKPLADFVRIMGAADLSVMGAPVGWLG